MLFAARISSAARKQRKGAGSHILGLAALIPAGERTR
jgi:hypothetical protein